MLRIQKAACLFHTLTWNEVAHALIHFQDVQVVIEGVRKSHKLLIERVVSLLHILLALLKKLH